MPSEPHIVIVGGGIIGCTAAYYLTRHSSVRPKVTLIEASVRGPAQGASGKAGGLVAKWAYPKELVNISFPEHERLAQEHNGKDRWGWRYVGCGSWESRSTTSSVPTHPRRTKSLEKKLGLPGDDAPSTEETTQTRHLPKDLDWVHEELTDSYAPMAKENETAQVHPYLFTTSMFELAKEKGMHYIHGFVIRVLSSSAGQVTGVEYRDPSTNGTTVLTATHVLIAAGAWSPRIVPQLPIESTRAHSVTFRPQEGVEIAPYVLFTEIKAESSRTSAHSPEIYARPGNEVYAGGPGDDSELPETVDGVVCDAEACQSIVEQVTGISAILRESEVNVRQACFLPSVDIGGGPIVGEAQRVAKNLYIATGHTCWGICNAPGTAKALEELILDGQIKCGNLKKLAPMMFI